MIKTQTVTFYSNNSIIFTGEIDQHRNNSIHSCFYRFSDVGKDGENVLGKDNFSSFHEAFVWLASLAKKEANRLNVEIEKIDNPCGIELYEKADQINALANIFESSIKVYVFGSLD